MIYIIATFLGLVCSVFALLCEATRGNIVHLENGREPNAGGAIFPTIIIIPLFFAGLAWVITTFFPTYDLIVFLGVAFSFTAATVISFLKVNAKFKDLKKSQ